MPTSLVLAPEAESDVSEAYGWYEDRRRGLVDEFLSCVDACLSGILRQAKPHAIVLAEYRRAMIRRFPYAVFYESTDDSVIVYAILHSSRDPEKWRRRLP